MTMQPALFAAPVKPRCCGHCGRSLNRHELRNPPIRHEGWCRNPHLIESAEGVQCAGCDARETT